MGQDSPPDKVLRSSRFGLTSHAAHQALKETKAILRRRRTIARDRRVPFEPPPPHLARLVFPCLVWTLGVAWQDRPWVVIGMGLPSTLYILYTLYGELQRVAQWMVHAL